MLFTTRGNTLSRIAPYALLVIVKLLHYNNPMDSVIHRLKNARIAMFLGDHPPAHVHLLGPGFKASIEVATLKTRGQADVRLVAEAKAWIENNREFIMTIWAKRGAKR